MPPSDPFLPVAPAQVKVLVLPVGPMHRDRFAAFLERLRGEDVVHLCDISADSRPNRNMFNPLAFPDGVIFYDLVTHVPQPSHLALSPFDLYREPLVVLALADGVAIKSVAVSSNSKRHSAGGRSTEERNIRALYQELEELRDTYTKALVHHVVLFDYVPSPDAPVPLPEEGLSTVPPVAQSKRTTMKAVMADVSSLLLAEMTTLARSFEAMAFVESPGQAMAGVFRGGIDDAPGGSGHGYSQSHSSNSSNSTLVASRRNSQYVMPTQRSSSAGGGMSAAERAQARMSMPVPFKSGFGSGSAGSTPGRPSTPAVAGSTGGDDSATAVGSSSPDRAGSPLDLGDGFRTLSSSGHSYSQSSHGTDRVSMPGFGAGGINERWRHKGKSRVTIVVASLYLQAGRWTDALKELIEGAAASRAINDHLWHGKALELIVVCLLLLAWAGVECQVPAVCLPPPEKGSAAQAAAAAAALEAAAAADKTAPQQPKWLRNLQQVLPDLLERILGLYTRISSENLPPLPLAEAHLRFSTLLAALHVADGVLDRPFLSMVVEGRYEDPHAGRGSGGMRLTTSPRLSVVPSRALVMGTLFRAFPSSATELLTTVDRIMLLSGIASVLGRLGYQRKKALVVREMLSVLTGGLVEARTRGAAEMGIHPAAGLLAQNGGGGGGATSARAATGAAALDLADGDIESGLEVFLGMLLKTYGVVEFEPWATAASATPGATAASTDDTSDSDSDEAIIARIHAQAMARMFGMSSNKLNLLRACIRFSEALPDFAGVLRFSSDLLRTAGSGIAPGHRRGDAAPVIGRDEQVRLVNNIIKTAGLARRLGLGPLSAEYWDEFLLRGVKLEPAPAACQPVAHTRRELPGRAGKVAKASQAAARSSQDVDPFIHNSFLKPSEKAAAELVLVADEAATFKLTLQNPYDVEVEIESVRLETEGAAFDAVPTDDTLLGPYRTQIVRVAGVPRAAGRLHVTGAVVGVHGCRPRRFPIFAQAWAPERPDRVKAIGAAPFPPGGAATTTAGTLVADPPLTAERVSFHVVPAQPMVVVESTTLPQSSVMVLEGERQVFSVTLRNLSTATAVDFLLFSFQDSTQASVQAALSNRDATPAELYEYELILAKKQALRLRGRQGRVAGAPDERHIGAGETATFDFEILGKPGLTSGTIQVDYAHVGDTDDDDDADGSNANAKFYTRQVALHLTVTVNAGIEVARMDVLPLHGRLPASLWARCRGEGAEAATDVAALGDPTRDAYCLLLVDLRNAWPAQMRVELAVAETGVVVTEHILPGNTSRVMVPLRRIYLEAPHATIPALNPARQRQFVVSTGKISPDAERAGREAFWYRERMLEALRGTWATVPAGGDGGSASASARARASGGSIHSTPAARQGNIELRSMRLTARMIEALKVDEVGIDMVMESCGGFGSSDDSDNKNGSRPPRPTRVVAVDDFVQLRVRVTNRTAQPLYPTLRLMPALCHRPLNVALDFTRKLAWNGTLQQTLPRLGARATTEVRLGLTALCRGEFEVTASVEETRLYRAGEGDGRDEDGQPSRARPRSNTETMMDAVLGPRERRIWHSRAPCHFVVVDSAAAESVGSR